MDYIQLDTAIKRFDDITFMRGDDNLDFPGKWLLDECGVEIKYLPYTDGISSTDVRERHSNGS